MCDETPLRYSGHDFSRRWPETVPGPIDDVELSARDDRERG
jgi:hypothetical protein